MAVTVPAATEQIDYADLYARWERGNWSAMDIDFTQDRIDWHEKFTDEQRRGALWLYTLFFHGEDSVADNLSPYIDAAPLEEQKYFLATQQVDEARHAVFFHRWMHEVVGVGDGSLGGGLRATQHELTWGHRKLFGRLDRMADELRRDHSPLTLARAVTLYHVVVEGTLAQPGQHMIETSLERMDLMPGFREGMRNVAIDEQRHIAFGVKLLADLYRENPQATQDAIVDLIREVLQYTLSVPIPPGWDTSYTESLGYSMEDLYEEGARANEARLRAIGLPLDEIAHFPFPMDITPRERGRQALALLRAGLLGAGDGGPGRARSARRCRSSSTCSRATSAATRSRPARRSSGTSPTTSRGTCSSRGRRTSARSRAASPSRPCACGCAGTTSASSSPSAPSPTTSCCAGGCARAGDPRVLLKLQRLFH